MISQGAETSKSAVKTLKTLMRFLLLCLGVWGLPGPALSADIRITESGDQDIVLFILEGDIESGDTLRLQSLVTQYPPDKKIGLILNSPGGNLKEGFELGRFAYKAKIMTFVAGFGAGCYSSCAIAFLGGRDPSKGEPARVLMSLGKLGFHQFRQKRDDKEAAASYTKQDMEKVNALTRQTIVDIIRYLRDIRHDMSWLHLMLQAPSADMKIIEREEAASLGFHLLDERNGKLLRSTNILARVQR